MKPPTARKRNVLLIGAAHDYKIVTIGKTNFWPHLDPNGIGEAATRMALRVRSAQRSLQVVQSVAAVRSTGLRLLHFSNPEGFRGYQPCRYLRYNYRIVMISKINFLRGFCLRQLRRRQLYYYNIVTGTVAFKPGQTGISLARSDCLGFAEAVLKELNRR